MSAEETKKAKFTSKNPKKAAAPAKAAKAAKPAGDKKPVGRAAVDQTISFKKAAKEGALKGQAALILDIVKAKGKMLKSELVKALEGKVTTKNKLGVVDVWNMNRKRLIDEGYLTVS